MHACGFRNDGCCTYLEHVPAALTHDARIRSGGDLAGSERCALCIHTSSVKIWFVAPGTAIGLEGKLRSRETARSEEEEEEEEEEEKEKEEEEEQQQQQGVICEARAVTQGCLLFVCIPTIDQNPEIDDATARDKAAIAHLRTPPTWGGVLLLNWSNKLHVLPGASIHLSDTGTRSNLDPKIAVQYLIPFSVAEISTGSGVVRRPV